MSDQEKEMMSEETILNGKFIFISYNHSDAEIVTKDVVLLHEKSVRVWFDVNMHASDNWKEVAEKCIKHPNCAGVLFYNSPSTFVSSACEYERKLAWERLEQGNFKYWYINLGGTTQDILNKAVVVAQGKGQDVVTNLFAYFANINKYFNDDVLRIHENNVVEELMAEAALVGAIDTIGQTLDAFKQEGRLKVERDVIELGIFIDKKHNAPLDYEHKQYERFEVSGKKYISFDNIIYTTKPLHWDVIATKDGYAILLCDRIIARCPGGEGAKDYLKHFVEVAFTQKQIAALDKPARLLSLADLPEDNQILPCNEKPFGNIHYWLEDKGLDKDWQMTCNDQQINKKGFLALNEKGLRPIIEIPNNRIDDFKKEH